MKRKQVVQKAMVGALCVGLLGSAIPYNVYAESSEYSDEFITEDDVSYGDESLDDDYLDDGDESLDDDYWDDEDEDISSSTSTSEANDVSYGDESLDDDYWDDDDEDTNSSESTDVSDDWVIKDSNGNVLTDYAKVKCKQGDTLVFSINGVVDEVVTRNFDSWEEVDDASVDGSKVTIVPSVVGSEYVKITVGGKDIHLSLEVESSKQEAYLNLPEGAQETTVGKYEFDVDTDSDAELIPGNLHYSTLDSGTTIGVGYTGWDSNIKDLTADQIEVDGKHVTITFTQAATFRVYIDLPETDTYKRVNGSFVVKVNEKVEETDSSDGQTDSSDGQTDSSDGQTDSSDGQTDSSDGQTEAPELSSGMYVNDTHSRTYKINLNKNEVSIYENDDSLQLKLSDIVVEQVEGSTGEEAAWFIYGKVTNKEQLYSNYKDGDYVTVAVTYYNGNWRVQPSTYSNESSTLDEQRELTQSYLQKFVDDSDLTQSLSKKRDYPFYEVNGGIKNGQPVGSPLAQYVKWMCTFSEDGNQFFTSEIKQVGEDDSVMYPTYEIRELDEEDESKNLGGEDEIKPIDYYTVTVKDVDGNVLTTINVDKKSLYTDGDGKMTGSFTMPKVSNKTFGGFYDDGNQLYTYIYDGNYVTTINNFDADKELVIKYVDDTYMIEGSVDVFDTNEVKVEA